MKAFLLPSYLIVGDFIGYIIVRIFLDILIGGYGALLRWLFNLGRKPYSYYYENEDGVTYAYTILGIAATTVIIIFLSKRVSG